MQASRVLNYRGQEELLRYTAFMEDIVYLPIVLKYPVCIEGLTENSVRELFQAAQVKATSEILNEVLFEPPAAYRVNFHF